MLTQEVMHDLAQGIIGAFEARTAGITYLRQATATQLHELNQAHNAMVQQQKRELQQAKAALDQAEEARRQEEAPRAQKRAQAVAHRKSEVDVQLQGHRDELVEVRGELAGVRAEWQELGEVMRAKRNGVTVGNASRRGRRGGDKR